MRLGRATLALLAVGACLCALASTAMAKTRVVHKGQSIQAAINAAKPGDTIEVMKGTYREALEITKDRIKLTSPGATLTPPATPPQTICEQIVGVPPAQVDGICIVGQVTPPSSPTGSPTVQKQVKDVRVSGLTFKGFKGNGALIFAAKGTVFQNDQLIGNGSYGAFANTSTGTQFLSDLAKGNKAPGLYVGDSPTARAFVHNNHVLNNLGEGVFLRSAEGGRVTGNLVQGNCAGILALADSPGPSGHWKISGNRVLKNNKACPGDPAEGEPPMSGIGIALSGADNTLVSLNQVLGNKTGNPSPIGTGGILVGKGSGGTVPKSDTILSNTLSQNTPFDIDWDGTGTVKFTTNHCSKGKPASTCKK